MRTFLAFNLAEDLTKELDRLIGLYKHHKNITWVKKKNLHMTMQFIGDTGYGDLTELDNLFSGLFDSLLQFEISEPEIEIIPYKKPKIVWVRVKTDNTIIAETIKKLRRKLGAQNYNIKNQSLKPHITLGRIKGRLDSAFFGQILAEKIGSTPSPISKITFYESVLKRTGSEYFPLGKYNLN